MTSSAAPVQPRAPDSQNGKVGDYYLRYTNADELRYPKPDAMFTVFSQLTMGLTSSHPSHRDLLSAMTPSKSERQLPQYVFLHSCSACFRSPEMDFITA